MLAGAPGLSRTVAACTQPHGPPIAGDLLRSLLVREKNPQCSGESFAVVSKGANDGASQKYLVDTKSTDNVYKALILRASAEPLR
jgi:hypothetical protein